MKSYLAERHIRLVGKAWEIKRQLNKMAQIESRNLTLAEYLSGILSYTAKSADHPIRLLNKR